MVVDFSPLTLLSRSVKVLFIGILFMMKSHEVRAMVRGGMPPTEVTARLRRAYAQKAVAAEAQRSPSVPENGPLQLRRRSPPKDEPPATAAVGVATPGTPMTLPASERTVLGGREGIDPLAGGPMLPWQAAAIGRLVTERAERLHRVEHCNSVVYQVQRLDQLERQVAKVATPAGSSQTNERASSRGNVSPHRRGLGSRLSHSDYTTLAKSPSPQRESEGSGLPRADGSPGLEDRVVRRHLNAKFKSDPDLRCVVTSERLSALYEEGLLDDAELALFAKKDELLANKASVFQVLDRRRFEQANRHVTEDLEMWVRGVLSGHDAKDELEMVLLQMTPMMPQPFHLSRDQARSLFEQLAQSQQGGGSGADATHRYLTSDDIDKILTDLDPQVVGLIHTDKIRQHWRIHATRKGNASNQRSGVGQGEEAAAGDEDGGVDEAANTLSHAVQLDEALRAFDRLRDQRSTGYSRPLTFQQFISWFASMGANLDVEDAAPIYAALQPVTRQRVSHASFFPVIQRAWLEATAMAQESVSPAALLQRLHEVDTIAASVDHSRDVVGQAAEAMQESQKRLENVHSRLKQQAMSARQAEELLPQRTFRNVGVVTEVSLDDTMTDLWESVAQHHHAQSAAVRQAAVLNPLELLEKKLASAMQQLRQKNDSLVKVQLQCDALRTKLKAVDPVAISKTAGASPAGRHGTLSNSSAAPTPTHQGRSKSVAFARTPGETIVGEPRASSPSGLAPPPSLDDAAAFGFDPLEESTALISPSFAAQGYDDLASSVFGLGGGGGMGDEAVETIQRLRAKTRSLAAEHQREMRKTLKEATQAKNKAEESEQRIVVLEHRLSKFDEEMTSKTVELTKEINDRDDLVARLRNQMRDAEIRQARSDKRTNELTDELEGVGQRLSNALREVDRLVAQQKEMVPIALMERRLKEAVNDASDELAAETSSKRRIHEEVAVLRKELHKAKQGTVEVQSLFDSAVAAHKLEVQSFNNELVDVYKALANTIKAWIERTVQHRKLYCEFPEMDVTCENTERCLADTIVTLFDQLNGIQTALPRSRDGLVKPLLAAMIQERNDRSTYPPRVNPLAGELASTREKLKALNASSEAIFARELQEQQRTRQQQQQDA